MDEDGYFASLVKLSAERTSKKHIERAVRNYNKICSKEKLAQGIQWKFDTWAEAIQQYASGEYMDILKLDAENFRRQGVSESRITNYLDHFIHKILRRRNEIWLDKLLSSGEQEGYTRVFIAAGFDHFQGPFNMLSMLQEEGFSIKRLDSSCKWDNFLVKNTDF